MHSRARTLARTMLCIAGVSPFARASAQDAAELTRRIDAAMAMRAEVATRYAALQSRQAAPRTFPDTVALFGGALRVLTTGEFRPIVQDAATRTEAFIGARAGATPLVLPPSTFSVWADSIRRAEHGVTIAARVDGREADGSNVIADAPSIAAVLEGIVQARTGTERKPAFAQWLGSALPLAGATNVQWRAIRVELVSSQASIARQCYQGDLAACKATLALVPTSDPATAWYDSVGRFHKVAALHTWKKLDDRVAAPCLAGSDAACIALVRGNPQLAGWLSAPGSSGARVALVQEAFDAGGAGSLARLAASEDTPTAAIAAIANAPLDSVLRRWQQHVRNGGVESESATPVVALTAAAWILMMGGVSLRSSRWR